MNPTPALLVAIHPYFGVTIPSRSQISSVTTALFSRGDERYLTVTKAGSEGKVVLVELADVTAGEVSILSGGQASVNGR